MAGPAVGRLRRDSGAVEGPLTSLGAVLDLRPESSDDASVIGLLTVLMGFAAPRGALDFPDACADGQRLTIAAAGDLVMQPFVQWKGARDGFETLWSAMAPVFRDADVSYLNLEGPIGEGLTWRAGRIPARSPAEVARALALQSWSKTADQVDRDAEPYTGYPRFNYPPALAEGLRRGHIDIVSTANNHSLDRHGVGVDATLDALEAAGVCHTGTRRRGARLSWSTVMDVRGFRLAWLGCTIHTNGLPDRHAQVRSCVEPTQRAALLAEISRLQDKVDAVIVTPHWGWEYKDWANKYQRAFAHAALDAGATMVLGAHPHVVQPVERYRTPDGRDTLVAWSLGNFISGHFRDGTRTSFVLVVGLTRRADGRTVINGVRHVPFWMEHRMGPKHMGVVPLGRRSARHRKAAKWVDKAISPHLALRPGEALETTPGCRVASAGSSGATTSPALPLDWLTEPACSVVAP